jgi:hypothetical protein
VKCTGGVLLFVAGFAVAAGVGVWTALGSRSSDFRPGLSGPDRLITNEYAHWNPHASDARRSRDWDVTSGSLFVRSGVGWTGMPDATTPGAASSAGTGSSVFRMNSFRKNLGDAVITLRVRNLRLLDGGGREPAEPTDGIHLFLRWQNPTELYVASLNRRDNLIVVKKKLHGGDENGGTYYTLAQAPYHPPGSAWQSFTVRITSDASTVTIAIDQGDHHLLRAVDDGGHGPPILRPGAVGLRGDNCEFEFTDLRAQPIKP